VLLFLRESIHTIGYHFILTIFWTIISYYSSFYEVYRFTKEVSIFVKLFNQFILISFVTFAYVGYQYKYVSPNEVWKFIVFSLITVSILKFSTFFLLKKYRLFYGGNLRRVVILGNGKDVEDLQQFFNSNADYGYKLLETFDLKTNRKEGISKSFEFITENKIDEIYASLNTLNNSDLDNLINFADNNLKTIKLLPDSKNRLLRNLALEYYGYIPIISLRQIPLDKEVNKRFKRFFDIIFSASIILFLMSWLTPLIALIIRLESKGPTFFKQKRNGLNYKEFNCYKFRSMCLNEIADIEQVQKNDPRVTKFGKIIRKFSIDELPQFFNVLLGDMSVVGPRPHMVSHTEMYAKSIDKFMVRHFIKPGITGLAQTKGFRGEVETEKDIVNRVKYDIFYIENWSFLLDIKIIIITVVNIFKGEDKAY